MNKWCCFFLLSCIYVKGQLLSIGWDTLTFIHNNKVLKHATAGGLNASMVFDADLNEDGKKDVVVFELGGPNQFGVFRCFFNKGTSPSPVYEFDYRLGTSFPLCQYWAFLTDFNLDGKKDLFTYTNAGIRVFKNLGYQNGIIQWKLEKQILKAKYNTPNGPIYSPIYASSYGFPAIIDLDNDSDSDILTFTPSGNYLESYINQSKELYGHSDSLVFNHKDFCWGLFEEYNCSVNLNACASSSRIAQPEGERHAGAALTVYDHNGNQIPDLLLSDIGCNSVLFLGTSGTVSNPVVSDTTIMFPNFPNKNTTRRLRMAAGCRTTLADTDGDGKNELFASPTIAEFENTSSVWKYNNVSSTPTVNWSFSDSAFLQSEMADVGLMSRPICLDVDADGKKDILIGSYGVFKINTRVPSVHYYKNVGTPANPAFSLVTSDFLSLSQFSVNNIKSMIVTPGDIDMDGDTDLILAAGGSTIHWYENTAGAGNACAFNTLHINPFGIVSNGAEFQPFVFDYDQDNKPDLIIANKFGKLLFYKNTGTAGSPSFSLISGAFPNVYIKGDISLYGIDGYACPFIWKQNSKTYMLAGNTTGKIYLYEMPTLVNGNATLLDSSFLWIYTGTYSTPWLEDLNGDAKPDLLCGNSAGGISYFSSASPFVGVHETIKTTFRPSFKLFPNPTENILYFKFSVETFDNPGQPSPEYPVIYNIHGKPIPVLWSFNPDEKTFCADVKHLPAGVYIFTWKHSEETVRACWIKKGE
jgi:hypothetical protein